MEALEHLEHLRRVGPGTVVEGERDVARLAGALAHERRVCEHRADGGEAIAFGLAGGALARGCRGVPGAGGRGSAAVRAGAQNDRDEDEHHQRAGKRACAPALNLGAPVDPRGAAAGGAAGARGGRGAFARGRRSSSKSQFQRGVIRRC